MAFMSPPSLPPAPVDGASPLQQQPGPWHVRQTARFAAAIAFPGERFVGVAMRVPGNAGPEDAALPWQTVVNEAVARFVGFYGEQVAIAALFHRHCVVGATCRCARCVVGVGRPTASGVHGERRFVGTSVGAAAGVRRRECRDQGGHDDWPALVDWNGKA